jgi:hypothetical protein
MKTLLFAVAMSLAMCDTPPPSPVPPPPDPTPRPGEFTCQTACDQFRFLGCAEAEPTPAGAPCVVFCENAQASSAPLDLNCIVLAKSCAQARECE